MSDNIDARKSSSSNVAPSNTRTDRETQKSISSVPTSQQDEKKKGVYGNKRREIKIGEDTYKGFLDENELPHGQGKMNYKNGDTFDGEFKHGKKDGKGIKHNMSTGDVYNGYYTNDLPNGQGVYTWKNGDRYDGNWHFGVFHGEGTKT